MSKKFLVIGSGISALGSIKALNKEGIYPDVYDTSIEIEEHLKDIKEKFRNSNQKDWKESDVKNTLLKFQDNEKIFSIPKKTLFSSSFFLENHKQKMTLILRGFFLLLVMLLEDLLKAGEQLFYLLQKMI